MLAVWSFPDEVSVSDIHAALPQTNAVAYTTVKTTMERLADKGILSRTRTGKAYAYKAVVSQADLERRIVTGTLDHLVAQFPDAVASFFVRADDNISDAQLALLREAIERQREKPHA